MGLNILKHVGIIVGSILIVPGILLWITGGARSLFSADPDAVTSASVILDQPSGQYYVLLNKALHRDADKLRDWVTFFEGGDVLYIFEDIACSVAASDTGGGEMAESFRSRLPENQMQVKQEDAVLLASRADLGLFDVLILSRECAARYKISLDETEEKEVVEIFVEDVTETGGLS